MLKRILATSALATLLATGLHAQTQTDTTDDPNRPILPEADATAPAADGTMTQPSVAEDTTSPAAPAADGTMSSPELVQDETVLPPADGTVTDTTGTAQTDTGVIVDDPATAQTGGMGADGLATDADTATAVDSWGAIDLSTVSADDLIGSDIVSYDNETIATIEDVLITNDGQVESLVARFGGFLGFGANRVLLSVDEVEMMQDENQNTMVRTNLTPESIETRPEY